MLVNIYKYIIYSIFFICLSCNVVESKIYGCMDGSACNYNPNANIPDDDRCIYERNECGICGGDVSGFCDLIGKPQYTTREDCESVMGEWIPDC